MNIKFIGHAGFLLEHGSVKLLCDPWVSESGAFLHSWHQFPPNDFIDKKLLYQADYLYISHLHLDHFDKDFLRNFPKEVKIIIADYISKTFLNELKELGFTDITELKDSEQISLTDDFKVTIFRDQSLYKIDSLILIEVDGKRILNKNDCHISKEDFSKFQNIDLLFAQFSGAMWYPAAYDYNDTRQKVFSARIKANLLNNFVDLANGVQAKHVIHCAGPPCFLEDQFMGLNFQGIFHDQEEVFKTINEKILGKLHIALPGDDITLEPFNIINHHPFNFENKRQFLEDYKNKRNPSIQNFLNKPQEVDMIKFSVDLYKIFSSK